MTDPIRIVVSGGAGGRQERFSAFLGEECLCTAREPLLSAARVLLARGIPPTTVLQMQHRGSATLSLRGEVGKLAALAVAESDETPPRFVKYRPFPGRERFT